MKRFLTKLLIFFLALAALTLFVNALYVRKFGYPGIQETEQYADMPGQIEVAVFGSSHARAAFGLLEPEGYGTFFNFSAGSQTLSYDMRLLDYYRSHLKKGGTAVITVSYISFFGVPEEETAAFESHNKRYYWILPSGYIKQYDRLTALCTKYFPSVAAYFNVFRVLPFTGREGILEEPEPQNEEEAYLSEIGGMVDPETIGDWADIRYDMFFVNEKLDADGHLIVNEEEINALYRMIAICMEEGVTPILVSTPIIAEFSTLIHEKNPAFFDLYESIIQQVCTDTGAAYFDYSEDARFIYDHTLFTDTDHLNKPGHEKFVKLFGEEVLGITQ